VQKVPVQETAKDAGVVCKYLIWLQFLLGLQRAPSSGRLMTALAWPGHDRCREVNEARARADPVLAAASAGLVLSSSPSALPAARAGSAMLTSPRTVVARPNRQLPGICRVVAPLGNTVAVASGAPID
jgi:hypothetical protein